jgi:integrase
MRNLPERAKRPATRRQYAQLINRVLALAVHPCRISGTSPLPKGFMPKVGKSPAFPFLYPDEESALMACEQVPLGFRMLWGFLAREGCRVSEALGLTFRDVDLERGAVSLDKNKTDDPRTWALDPSVAEALRRWRDRRQARPGEAVFAGIDGGTCGSPSPTGAPARRWRRPAGAPRARHESAPDAGPRPPGHLRHPEPGQRPNRDVGSRPNRPQVQSDDQPVPARGSFCY